MATRGWEELDRGLGSCQAGKDLSVLAEPQKDRIQGTSRLADPSSWPHDPQKTMGEGRSAYTRPKKIEKEPAARGAPGSGKEKLKAGASPGTAPAHKKMQAASPPQPLPPPPALSEELPWGEVTLNKCLVLASLVALLGSAFQLCRDTVFGEVADPAPAPELWAPPSLARKEPASLPPMLTTRAPLPGPPAPQAEARDRPKISRNREATEKDEEEPGKTAGEDRAPLADRGPKERRRKKERPRKERPRKEERPRRERPSAASKANKVSHQPWARDSRDAEYSKRQPWASPLRPNEQHRPLGRQKHSVGKGRD
ncbi:junctional sarcoplasmic reticulum protein 1 [Nycticebus coucang]|uniref:junctional sarcoplasmic reticulum protein 1 n=1 Tax=Nycticebus coucang TaxID=9470 RepID=UPI00234D0035|nr:junctional sarcoplasmic reticulum protein 1 [Nycticebus coucang]XP_053426726.1 junctional sarcoplasmic reticulum protein 1 [Nycticebus coucang]